MVSYGTQARVELIIPPLSLLASCPKEVCPSRLRFPHKLIYPAFDMRHGFSFYFSLMTPKLGEPGLRLGTSHFFFIITPSETLGFIMNKKSPTALPHHTVLNAEIHYHV